MLQLDFYSRTGDFNILDYREHVNKKLLNWPRNIKKIINLKNTKTETGSSALTIFTQTAGQNSAKTRKEYSTEQIKLH